MSLTFEVPDETATPGSEAERERLLLLEVACTLYARDLLSLGRAAALAGLSKFDFGREVGGRGIARHYTEAELEADLAYARRQ